MGCIATNEGVFTQNYDRQVRAATVVAIKPISDDKIQI